REGKLEKAWSLLQELEARFGDRVEIRLAKAAHLYRRDDAKQNQAIAQPIAQLAEHIDAFTAAEQEMLLRSIGQALLKIGDIDGARKLLAELRSRRPSWARVPALEGELYELEDEPELAIRKYLQAFELGERDSVTVRRLLQLLSAQNRFVEAQQIVARMPEQL